MESIEGKVVVVTGASRGIGEALVRSLLREGASVAGIARDPEALARACTPEGLPAALAVSADVGDEIAVENAFDRVVGHFGRIDVLINAAGVLVMGPIEELSLNDWEASLRTNLTGVFLCSRAAVRRMSAGEPEPGGLRGQIVQIVSGAGVRAWVGAGAYTASKFGVMGFSDVLREEVRDRGIRVTDILPGMVDTSMTDRPEFGERVKLDTDDVVQVVLAALMTASHAMVKRVDLRNLTV
jgi:NAD(P)-dependent dehydrogenase (short-subunit alcohol dehydrogenase family)